MEYQTTTIWSRLLTKRQRSSLSPFSDLSKTFGFLDNQKEEQLFFNQANENLIVPDTQKKVKISQSSSEMAFLKTNIQIDLETMVKSTENLRKQSVESPCTRIDEFSPNLMGFFTPPIKFNDNLLGSPANYDLERDSLEDGDLELRENHTGIESLRECYDLNKEIQQIIEKKKGKIMLEKEIYHERYFFFIKCSFDHIWETNLSTLRNGEWCNKCHEKFQKCLQFAEMKRWTLLNEIFLYELNFRCLRGHLITTTSKNYEHKISCAECKRIARKEYLEHLKAQEEKNFQERLKNQERLFEESRRKSNEEQLQKPKEKDSKSIIEAYKQIKLEIEPLAIKYAKDYIEKKSADNSYYPKYLEVYKILLIPDDIFKLFLNSLDVESLKKEYRFLARNIHPDKNNHPKSASAFQKLNKLYEEALNKAILL